MVNPFQYRTHKLLEDNCILFKSQLSDHLYSARLGYEGNELSTHVSELRDGEYMIPEIQDSRNAQLYVQVDSWRVDVGWYDWRISNIAKATCAAKCTLTKTPDGPTHLACVEPGADAISDSEEQTSNNKCG